MRPKERIDKYFKLFIQYLDNADLSFEEKELIRKNEKLVLGYWNDNPDQRLPQVIYNLFGFVKYHFLHYLECFEYLSERLNVPKRDLLIWGSFGKDGKGPLEQLWIDEMETSHIEAILETQTRLHPDYKEVFEEELKLRNENK